MSNNWFIALRVPAEPWFDAVGDAPDRVRMFHPADLHITVAFLGPVDRDAADAAFALAPKWPTPPLDVTLSAIVPMGNPRHPNALAAEIAEGGAGLNAAIASVREAMCLRAGARPDDRAPRAHVTIARLARKSSRPERTRAIQWGAALDLAEPRIHLSELILYRGRNNDPERLFREHDIYELGSRRA